jgi:hypothetical protein
MFNVLLPTGIEAITLFVTVLISLMVFENPKHTYNLLVSGSYAIAFGKFPPAKIVFITVFVLPSITEIVSEPESHTYIKFFSWLTFIHVG